MIVPISTIQQHGRVYVDANDYAAFLESCVREAEGQSAEYSEALLNVSAALRKLVAGEGVVAP